MPSTPKARKPRSKASEFFDTTSEAELLNSTPPSAQPPRHSPHLSDDESAESGSVKEGQIEEHDKSDSESGAEAESESESEIYEEFDLGGLTQEEVREINRVAPHGQKLQDVISPKKARRGKGGLQNIHDEKAGKLIDSAWLHKPIDAA